MIRVMVGLSLVVTGWGISLAMLTTFPLYAVLHYLYIYNIVRICDTLQIYILFCRKSRNEMDPKEACTKSICKKDRPWSATVTTAQSVKMRNPRKEVLEPKVTETEL